MSARFSVGIGGTGYKLSAECARLRKRRGCGEILRVIFIRSIDVALMCVWFYVRRMIYDWMTVFVIAMNYGRCIKLMRGVFV